MQTLANATDVVVFSHLRWDFVFQRPQQLLTRCARQRRVWFIEEPMFAPGIKPTLDVSMRSERVFVAVPHLPSGRQAVEHAAQLRSLVDELVQERVHRRYVAWYYTPMALQFSRHLRPAAVVYDCMDELSNFRGAPPELRSLEEGLFDFADVVFTGGVSLYEHKRAKHSNVHPFPSSVDYKHFRAARECREDPADQREIPGPRIGYFGVIDERLDLELLRAVAEARPQWHFVLVGPVVKIDPSTLPQGPNLHYLGEKKYADLPAYLAGWHVAIMPFARNDATRFISPTKTPEYLAAGRRVVSTSIRDVVRTYGEAGLVRIADDPPGCMSAIEHALTESCQNDSWYAQVDAYLSRMSWDQTFYDMWRLVERSLALRASRSLARLAHVQPAPVSAAAATPAAGSFSATRSSSAQ